MNQQILNVLVVDDDPVVRFVHTKILTNAGCHVIQAENGEVAVNLTKEQQFNIILMDVQMPILDGIAATQKIRAHQSTYPLYILGVTNSNVRKREECLANGMNDVIFKPIQIDQLLKLLLQVIQPKS